MYWVKKKTCLSVLDRGDRDKDNAIGLKEGGVIKIETTVLSLRDARSFALYLLTVAICGTFQSTHFRGTSTTGTATFVFAVVVQLIFFVTHVCP